MKRIACAVFCVLLFISTGLWAENQRGVSLGLRILAGGRYDNVRMCVGSAAGVPGGPIGEVYLDVRVPVSESGAVVINVPLFRPIMFAAAFDMLQLEPTVMYEHTFGDGTGTQPVVGGGLGIILHHGPDYHSSQEDRGDSFFSVGPLLNGFAGLKFGETNVTAGVKGFFSPLFTAERSTGVVAGGGLELHYNFK